MPGKKPGGLRQRFAYWGGDFEVQMRLSPKCSGLSCEDQRLRTIFFGRTMGHGGSPAAWEADRKSIILLH